MYETKTQEKKKWYTKRCEVCSKNTTDVCPSTFYIHQPFGPPPPPPFAKSYTSLPSGAEATISQFICARHDESDRSRASKSRGP